MPLKWESRTFALPVSAAILIACDVCAHIVISFCRFRMFACRRAMHTDSSRSAHSPAAQAPHPRACQARLACRRGFPPLRCLRSTTRGGWARPCTGTVSCCLFPPAKVLPLPTKNPNPSLADDAQHANIISVSLGGSRMAAYNRAVPRASRRCALSLAAGMSSTTAACGLAEDHHLSDTYRPPTS